LDHPFSAKAFLKKILSSKNETQQQQQQIINNNVNISGIFKKLDKNYNL
jgi:hypothetical protein